MTTTEHGDPQGVVHLLTGPSTVECSAPMRDPEHPDGWYLAGVDLAPERVTCPACRPAADALETSTLDELVARCGAPADTPEAETALELCPACDGELDGDYFHDLDTDTDRTYCAACCPTCVAERDELDARRARVEAHETDRIEREELGR